MTLNIEILDAKIQSKEFDFSFNYKGNIDGCVKILELFNKPEKQISHNFIIHDTGSFTKGAAPSQKLEIRPMGEMIIENKPPEKDEAKITLINQKYTVEETAKLFEMGLSTFYAKQAQGVTPKPDIIEGNRRFFSNEIIEKYLLKMKQPPVKPKRIEIEDGYAARTEDDFEENTEEENDLVNGLKKILGK